jgi:hypothetical protein
MNTFRSTPTLTLPLEGEGKINLTPAASFPLKGEGWDGGEEGANIRQPISAFSDAFVEAAPNA